MYHYQVVPMLLYVLYFSHEQILTVASNINKRAAKIENKKIKKKKKQLHT